MHDLHVHTSFSDGDDDLATVVEHAQRAGVRTLGISDHVRSTTTWLGDYHDALDRAESTAHIEILRGVEAKMIDTTGRLDLPDDVGPLDYVLVADHQVPSPHGVLHPDAVRNLLDSGRLSAGEVVSWIMEATVAAAKAAPAQPIVAHLFSVLPKIGISDIGLPPALIARFADALHSTGAWVEINEKWRCPSYTVAMLLDRAGVPIVAGSDSHRAVDVGRYSYVLAVGGRLVGMPARAA